MNEQTIWNFLKKQGLTDCGVAGLMGNLYAESLLNPMNLETAYETKLGFTDSTYTKAVDNGSYKNFTKDSAGYGLAQWTYGPRKRNLLDYAKSIGASIGDLNMQLNFLVKELTSPEYVSLWNSLKIARSIYDATVEVMVKYEKPANVSSSAKNGRYNHAKAIYDRHHGKKEELNYPRLPASPANTYTVCKGDTLTKIARMYSTTIDAILANNQATYPTMTRDNIAVGWVLKV